MIHLVASRPVEFFDDVYAQFKTAESYVIERSESFFQIAGQVIRLRFAGSAVRPYILPALEHLRIPPHPQPHLTVCLWDVASTGVNLPKRPWRDDAVISRGEVRGFEDRRIYTAYRLGPNMLSMLDTERNLGLFCTNSATHIPSFFGGSALHDMLQWWLSLRGLQFVHAGAVGKRGGGVLLAGKSGSGKSTTALSCLRSDLLYASDDYCVITPDPAPYVYSVYSSAKLNPDHSARFPHLASLISNREEVEETGEFDLKHILYLHGHYTEKLTEGFPVKAIFVPRVTGQPRTKIVAASPMEGLKALTPSSLFQLSGAGENAFRRISRFVRSVPTLRLDLGTDLAEIPSVISRYLSEH